MEQIHSRTAELVWYVTDIQVKMVQESEGEQGNPAIAKDQISETEHGPVILYTRLSHPFTPEPVRNYLRNGCEPRQNLESEMLKYSEFISELQSGDYQNYSWPLEASRNLTELLPEKTNVSMISGLHSLELMKNTLLLIESELLNAIANQQYLN